MATVMKIYKKIENKQIKISKYKVFQLLVEVI